MSKGRGLLHHLITIICLLIIIGSSAMIVLTLYPKYKEEKALEEIQDIGINNSNNQKTIDWESLKQANGEIIGWITVPGTHIDYPVVQTDNNDFYLTHNFNQEYSRYGTPFLDYIYDFDHKPAPQNSVIYAHSSSWGDQIGFEGLNNFEDQNYYRDHPYVYWTTIYDGDKPVQYEIVAVIKEHFNFDYRRPDFEDQKDFLSYYNNILGVSLYDTGKSVYADDEMVTLSTCVFDVDNARVAVIARKVKPEKKKTEETQKKSSSNNSKNNSSDSSSTPNGIELLNDPELAEDTDNL